MDLRELRRSTSIPRLWVIIPAHRSHGNLAEAGYVVSKNVKWNSGDRMAKPAHYQPWIGRSQQQAIDIIFSNEALGALVAPKSKRPTMTQMIASSLHCVTLKVSWVRD